MFFNRRFKYFFHCLPFQYKFRIYARGVFNFFSYIKIFSFFFSFLFFYPSFGFAQQHPCGNMKSQYDSLLKGTISNKASYTFFTCIHDGLVLFSERHGHDSRRNYFNTEDIAKFFYYSLDFSPVKSWEFAVKALIIKKILVGGDVNKLGDRELRQLIHLTYDYELFFIHIKRWMPFFHAVLKGKAFSISSAKFNKAVKRLQWAFAAILQAYRKRGISYSVSDFHQIDEYARILKYEAEDFLKILKNVKSKEGSPVVLDFQKTVKYANRLRLNPFGFREAEQWKILSDFLHFWGNGIFTKPITGNRWEAFANSISPLISLFFTHRVYIAGRDVFEPQVFSTALSGLEMLVDSILQSESAHKNKGFPATHFTGIVKAILSQAESSRASPSSPLTHLIKPGEEGSLDLIVRALICFSIFPTPSNCKVFTSNKNFEPISAFSFPDGRYVFQRNGVRQWIPSYDRGFKITKSQLQSLKHWLQKFRSQVDNIEKNPHLVAKKYNFSHWMSDFFGEDKRKRIRFGFGAGRESQASLSYSLLNYSVFLELLLSPWLKQTETKKTFSLDISEWKQLTNKIFPVIAVLFQIDYTEKLKGLSYFLFEYGDLLLNSSNRNEKIEFNELLDIAAHIVSAQKSSQPAFEQIKLSCGKELKQECINRRLFHNISNFPQILDYIANFGKSDFASSAKELFPGTVEDAYDLMPFFLMAQLTEVLFYKYDFNKDFQLEQDEFQKMARGLESKITLRSPHIHNDRQAEIYLRYAIQTGRFPFLMEKKNQILDFSSLDVGYWITHSESYKNLPIYRYQVFAFSVNLYNLYKNYGKKLLGGL